MSYRRLTHAAASIALVLLSTGCGNSDSILSPNSGRVQFVLSSGSGIVLADGGSAIASTSELLEDGNHDEDRPERPRHFFVSANVTFSSVLVRNVSGVLVNVGMELPVNVDVVRMDGGREVALPPGELPADTYDQVVVVMTAVQGVTHDGTRITIEPPGGGWTAIVPICEFTVEEGGETTVELQFMLGGAFRWWNNRFHFQPRFVCEQESEEPVA